MKHAVCVLLLATGCDDVFSVDHVNSRPPDAAIPIDAVEACPATQYLPVTDASPSSVYRYVSSNGLTWDAAEADCEADSQTKVTHLVVFDDLAEMAALRAIVTAQVPWQVFTGYARNSDAQGGTPYIFTAVTGGAALDVDSALWEKVNNTEPDNGGTTGGEETITFFEASRNLTDGPANIQLSYICECDGRPANQTFRIR